MQASQISAPADLKQEKVILVHGTFASVDGDEGDEWWQIGSPAHGELQSRLPENISLADSGSLFRWSGENNERARSKAAVELLEHIAPLEKEGKPYHLIGHSHGGSVIWTALRLATARKEPLQQLQSWSTVGTPFLHQRTRSPWSLTNVVYMALSIMLIVPAARVFLLLGKMPYDLAMGNLHDGLIMRNSHDAGVAASVLRAPFVELLSLCGVPFTPLPEGIRIGSFSPDSGHTLSEFLFQTGEGWLILATIVIFGYITLLLGISFIRPVLESLRIRWEQSLERRAFQKYGKRWLGLWSTDDEAINGLRATLELQVSFLGKLTPRDRIFFSDSVTLLARPCLWVLGPLYNHIILPILDTAIRGIVIRTAQGNNRPTAQVVAVDHCPILSPTSPNFPPLPTKLAKQILANADHYAGDLGPKLRHLIAQPSFSAGLEKFGKELSGGELVHTSYFNYPEIIELLVLNIAFAEENAQRLAGHFDSKEMVDWFLNCKQVLNNEVLKWDPNPQSQDTPPQQPLRRDVA